MTLCHKWHDLSLTLVPTINLLRHLGCHWQQVRGSCLHHIH